jgi:hypothetical protein
MGRNGNGSNGGNGDKGNEGPSKDDLRESYRDDPGAFIDKWGIPDPEENGDNGGDAGGDASGGTPF